jgi:hypothetical protein
MAGALSLDKEISWGTWGGTTTTFGFGCPEMPLRRLPPHFHVSNDAWVQIFMCSGGGARSRSTIIGISKVWLDLGGRPHSHWREPC